MSNLKIAIAPEYNTNRIRAALQACESYFEERADAEYFTDSASPVGNEEMQLLVEVQEAIEEARQMSKQIFIEEHLKLAEEYAEAHPDVDWQTCYDVTADEAYLRMTDRLADMADNYRDRMKEQG